jgi:putative CocE/NonD family hydrolase
MHFIRWHTLALAALATAACVGDAPDRVSEFGRYEGYSTARYEAWVTTSQYVEMRDGVRLAVDVTRPTIGGTPVSDPLPVIWTHSRYHRNPQQLIRAFAPDADVSAIHSMVDAQGDLQHLVRHGYIVASVAVRGSGASYGSYEGLFSDAETQDAYDIIDWLASQPWSDGNIGMFGGSYLGITQYMAASRAHPALKAIVPNVAGLDMYDVIYPGGVYRDDMVRHWGELTRNLDVNVPAPRVDEDVEGIQLREAVAQHAANWDVTQHYSAGRFRDHESPALDWEDHGPSGVLSEVREAAVPAYHLNGWFDIFVTDATLYYANYGGPQRLAIGAWSHAGMPDSALMAERGRLGTIEQHRWFDYWLKGIDNGIMKEAPISYAVMVDPGEWYWQTSETWPPSSTPVHYYFQEGPSESVESANDGRLATEMSAEAGSDSYRVDYTASTGTQTRWDNAVGAAPVMVYPDLWSNDAKGLTYTTSPLSEDVAVAGHAVLTVYLTSTTPDVAILALLEEIDEAGASHYVTEGVLRAAHRDTTQAPWNNLGLPYHRNYREDRDPVESGEVVVLRFDLHPTATVFNAGHRIRVTLLGADADNLERVPARGTPTVEVFFSSDRPSAIQLPVVPARADGGPGVVGSR